MRPYIVTRLTCVEVMAESEETARRAANDSETRRWTINHEEAKEIVELEWAPESMRLALFDLSFRDRGAVRFYWSARHWVASSHAAVLCDEATAGLTPRLVDCPEVVSNSLARAVKASAGVAWELSRSAVLACGTEVRFVRGVPIAERLGAAIARLFAGSLVYPGGPTDPVLWVRDAAPVAIVMPIANPLEAANA